VAGKVGLIGGSKAIELGGQVVDKGKEVVAGVIDSAGLILKSYTRPFLDDFL